MAIIGYARVSRKDQNLDRQIKRFKNEGCTKVFTDKLSGKNTDRPGLDELLDYIRDGDVVLITELKRLGRNNKDLTNIMLTILSKGATVEALDLPSLRGIEDENLRRLLNNMIIEIYKYQAQQELEEIRELQQQGIEIAKAKGKYKGRKPKFKKDDPQLQHAFELYETGKYTLKELEKITKIPENTFRRYRKKYYIEKKPDQ